jgi:putative flippase GtrA
MFADRGDQALMGWHTELAKEHIGPLFRQALIGVVCLCLNLLLMWWLVARARMPVLGATTVSFFVLNVLAHHLLRSLVFASAHKPYPKSLLRFLLVMAGSLAFNLGAMVIATEWLGMHYLLGSIAIAGIFFVGNYSAHYNWTFR